jgi:hypothetical protein
LCQRDTNHEILKSHTCEDRRGSAEHPLIVVQTWRILKCCGCDSVKANLLEESDGFKCPREAQLPPVEMRKLPDWKGKLPAHVQQLISEVYVAMNCECLCLSTMGARTIVDSTLTAILGEDIDGFEQKLKRAVAIGKLTRDEMDIIEAALEAGHAASHRGFSPSLEQLRDLLDIVEHALRGVYALPAASQRLTASVPPRQRKGG